MTQKMTARVSEEAEAFLRNRLLRFSRSETLHQQAQKAANPSSIRASATGHDGAPNPSWKEHDRGFRVSGLPHSSMSRRVARTSPGNRRSMGTKVEDSKKAEDALARADHSER